MEVGYEGTLLETHPFSAVPPCSATWRARNTTNLTQHIFEKYGVLLAVQCGHGTLCSGSRRWWGSGAGTIFHKSCMTRHGVRH